MENEDVSPTVMDAVRHFGDITGMHGVPNVAVSRSWPRRIVWILLTLAGAGMCVWQLVVAIEKLRSFPTSTTTTVVYASPMNFPAVTFCNLNPLRYAQLWQYNSSVHVQEMLSRINVPSTGPPTVSTSGSSTGTAWGNRDKVNARTDYTNQSIVFKAMANFNDSMVKAISYDINDVLIDCSFRGFNCVPSDFLTFRSARFGNCFLFNSGRYANGSAETVRAVNKTGSDSGLSLTLYVDQSSYLPEIITKAGYKLLIHDRNRPPLPESSGYEVAPGFETSFGLRTTIFERAGPPYGNCSNFSTTANQTMNHLVTQLPMTTPTSEVCMQTCEQLEVIKECGCNSYSNGLSSGAPFKSLNATKRGTSCKVLHDTADYQCAQRIARRVADPGSSCKTTFCRYQECIVIRYDATPSFSLWPAERAFNGLTTSVQNHPDRAIVKQLQNKTSDQLRDFIYRNFVKVNIHFDDLNINYILTEESYGGFDFLSDLGGIFGLWLGFSMLTFFELVELVIDIFITIYYTCKMTNIESKVESKDDESMKEFDRREGYDHEFSRPARRREAAGMMSEFGAKS